jgi:hypothetical protein
VVTAACARQETPAASPSAAMDVPSLAAGDANNNGAGDAGPATEPARANREREAGAALPTGDTLWLGSVRMGNQRPLRPVAVAFATYLNAIHAPIHREFSDKGLAQLEALPPNHPLANPRLVARLELVLDGATGAIVKVGVVKPSGLTAFDVLAVDSVMQAGPYGEAPAEIRSTDGNVYVHWEFGRDPTFGCSTVHVRPFLLTIDPPAVKTP